MDSVFHSALMDNIIMLVDQQLVVILVKVVILHAKPVQIKDLMLVHHVKMGHSM